ncbi:MAG: uroporphyrinogen decarboxylase [Thermodesulfobacteriota bacterium]|nr:uroporphyrinogen decarboxylase [Thermodesulfobacteriota bacterium]
MPIDFAGLRVVSFESRQADEMAKLITEAGGKPLVAPTMREVPLQQNSEVFTFAKLLLAGWLDVLILMTGVGTRLLVQTAATKYDVDEFVDALKSIKIFALGPKPVAALREMGLAPAMVVPKPYTPTDLLAVFDDTCPLGNKRVAVQEYGEPDPKLIKQLEDRGAQILAVPVYRWDLPEDLEPLRRAIRDIIADGKGKQDVALFTSATQVQHLFKVAAMDGLEDKLREAFKEVLIGSVGPSASRAIAEQGLTVDYEPDTPKMTHLVREMARRGNDLLQKKRTAHGNQVNTNSWQRIDMVWQPGVHGQPTIDDSLFMKACRRQETAHTPIWIMRQAGRYQREYLRIRKKVSMLELCKTPELASEVTLMAVDRLGVDAAIIFADILLVTEPMGLALEFVKGEGPVIHNPVRTGKDVDRLRDPDVDELAYVFDALRITRRALRPDVALIGFAGAPFTIASYMIEGGKSSHYVKTKTMMYRDTVTWHRLMERLAEVLIAYLNGQIAAGANALQLFDSWVGSLSPDDYRQFVMPHVQRLMEGLDRSVPVIHFSTGNPALLPLMKQAGGQVMGLDWRCDLGEAWSILGDDVAVMGNMDPIVLYASPKEIRAHVQAILDKAAGRPGHIFNLGHGILPDMPPENVAELVDAVHELSAK